MVKSRASQKKQIQQGTVLLASRPLLSPDQAGGLQSVFKILANDTRLRMMHALVRETELCVSELAATLAMKPQAVSNQLQKLSDLGILCSRRSGNNIYYRIVNPCVAPLLDLALCLTEDACREPNASCCSPKGEMKSKR